MKVRIKTMMKERVGIRIEILSHGSGKGKGKNKDNDSNWGVRIK